MSVDTENTADESETCGTEQIGGKINRISLELIEERMRANLERRNEQVIPRSVA